jgi:outer membrane protein OmpA-like peptidoglycan-associated protein
MTGAERKELLSENVEGKRTRIMYVGPTDLSPLGVLRNYQKAFDDLGEVEEIYTCKGDTCFSNLGGVFIWRKSNQIPSIAGSKSQYLYSNSHYYRDQIYWYGKVTTPESLYHISVYSAFITDRAHSAVKEFHNHPMIHLEVVEVADFKSTLEAVTAVDMTTKISEKGHIALYGIHFDSDSDTLKSESDLTLEEIVKALKADMDLNIYVVGHTDNIGALEYNEDLSKRRAVSVANKLTSKFGIAGDRVSPVGVGPVSPVATNKTEEGRALNRRVELVER